jgi:hypothetical protein
MVTKGHSIRHQSVFKMALFIEDTNCPSYTNQLLLLPTAKHRSIHNIQHKCIIYNRSAKTNFILKKDFLILPAELGSGV